MTDAVRSTLIAAALLATPVMAEDDLVTIGQELAGISDNYWTAMPIPVCFTHASGVSATTGNPYRTVVRQWVERTWGADTGVTFSGWGTCAANAPGINVELLTSVHANSQQGPGSDDRAKMQLQVGNSGATIVHEFGHALNFGHSQLREDRPGYCNAGPGNSTAANVADELTPYDDVSIMNYCDLDRQAGGWLSPLDIAGAVKIYGRDRRNSLGSLEAGDEMGAALATGDVNDDKIPDLVVGAPGEAIGSEDGAGYAMLYLGTPKGALRPVGGITQRGLGRDEAGDGFGAQVLMANLDGRPGDEIVVFAPNERPGDDPRARGSLFAYEVVRGATPPGMPPNQHDYSIEPIAAFTAPVSSLDAVGAGRLQAAAGDLDGDGRDEIWYSIEGVFGARIVGVELDAGGVFRMVASNRTSNGTTRTPSFAPSLAIGDVAGGPDPELIAGYYMSNRRNSGPPTGVLVVYRLEGSELTVVQEPATPTDPDWPHARADYFGRHMAVGDFDGDGRDDVAVTADGATYDGGAQAGAVAVMTGGWDGLRSWRVLGQESLSVGNSEPMDRFGRSIAAGDFDGDGIDDLAIGIDEVVPGRTKRPGYAVIAYGGRNGMGRAHWITQHAVGADEDGDRFGTAFAAADLDGRGRDELIVGAPGEAPGADPKAGFVFVYRTPYRPLEAWYAFGQKF